MRRRGRQLLALGLALGLALATGCLEEATPTPTHAPSEATPLGAPPKQLLPTLTPPEPSPTPAPTPTPTLAPEQQRTLLATGLLQMGYGQYDMAITTFHSLLAQGTEPDLLAQAPFHLAQGYFLQRDYARAAGVLERSLAEQRVRSDTLGPTLFLLGRTYRAAGNGPKALETFRQYLAQGGVASDYTRLQIGEILREMNRPPEALVVFQDLFQLGTAPPLVERRALEHSAAIFEGIGDYAGAVRSYERLLGSAEGRAEQGRLAVRIALNQRRLGQETAALERLLQVVYAYPSTPAAGEALATLDEMRSAAVNPYFRGLVAYYQRDTDRAVALFQQYLVTQPRGELAPWARYYLSLAYERKGQWDNALGQLEQLLQQHPAHEQADDALWEMAEILEGLARYPEAADRYGQLKARYPFSKSAFAAAFRQGLTFYRLGQPERAYALWEALLPTATNPEERSQLGLWRGKALLSMGNAADAQQRFAEAQAQRPNFYALRSHELAAGRAPFSPKVAPTLALEISAAQEATERQEFEKWMSRWAFPRPEGAPSLLGEPIRTDAAFRRGQELVAVGLTREAQAEFQILNRRWSADPWATYQLSLFYREVGLYNLSLSLAHTLLARSPAPTYREAPRFLQRLLYPTYFRDLALPEAKERDLDPLLLFSLIWQESLFNPQARSPSEALGLTQVIPPTGRGIAQSLRWGEFDPEELFRPWVSVRFGAAYLASMQRYFGGSPLFALAAYNGGPGNTERWLKGDRRYDPDLFVEDITLDEPKLYIKRITQHYEAYRTIYGP